MLLVERDLAACCRESSLSLEQIFGQSAENASHSFAPYTLPSAKRLSRATLRATSEPQVAVGNIMAEARQIALRLQATGGSELELDSVLVPGRVVEGNYLSEGEWFSGVIDKVCCSVTHRHGCVQLLIGVSRDCHSASSGDAGNCNWVGRFILGGCSASNTMTATMKNMSRAIACACRRCQKYAFLSIMDSL